VTYRGDYIRETSSGQWEVLSEEGKRLGIFPTKEQAEERLRQIEAFKHMEGGKKDAPEVSPEGVAVPASPRHATPSPSPSDLASPRADPQLGETVRENQDDGKWVPRVDRLGQIVMADQVELHIDLDGADRENLILAHMTPQGYLKLEGNISSVGVYEYSDKNGNTWGELRTAEEVFKKEALDSFKMLPLCDDHPNVMVDADNVAELQRGQLGSNVRPDGKHVRADILVTHPDLIDKIKEGKQQLSCGYEARVLDRSGVAEDGTPYQAVQAEIRGNHLAVVDSARGGPTCAFLFDRADGAYSTTGGTSEMKVQVKKDGTVVIEGTEYTVPDEVAAAFQALIAKPEEEAVVMEEGDQEGQEEEEKKEESASASTAATPTAATPTATVSIDSLKAQIDTLEAALKAERDSASVKIDARVALVTKARDILGAEAKTDGVTDIDLMRQVVAKVTPAMKSKVDKGSADYVAASYEMAVQQHATKVDSSEELMTLTHDAPKTDAPVDLDGMYKAHLDRMAGVTKEAN